MTEEELEMTESLKKRYTVLSFIMGKGYEILHEIFQPQDDVEYLMITDDPNLKSSTWKVVFDEDLLKFKDGFERCFRVRYNVFKYCSTDICVTIDGSMEVTGSLDEIIDKFESEQHDICLMPHPLFSDFISEYKLWIEARKYPLENTKRFFKLLADAKYDPRYKGLFQICFSIKRRGEITKAIDDMTMALMQYLSIGQEKFERLDQTVFSFVMNRYFNHLKVLPVSEQVVRSKAIQWYWHKSQNKNLNAFYDINKSDMKYVFDKPVECMYLK